MLHVTLRQLEYVVAVAKAGSLSAAAAVLNVSQPALSVAIGQVENRVGEALFQRRKGIAVTLTPFGRLFLPEAETLLADAARLDAPGMLSRRPQGHVRLGILDELAPNWLAPILRRLRQAFPQTEISCRTVSFEALADKLLSGQIDLGLTYDLGLDASFRREAVARAAPYIWVPPEDPLAGRSMAMLAEIADRPLILSDQGLSIRHMLTLFAAIGRTPRICHRASSIELLRSLAANGEGTGLSYTRPLGGITSDGLPICRVVIGDSHAIEPIVLASAETQPAPLPAIRAEICHLGAARDLAEVAGATTETG